jgi:GNAT superfamily N-acetyltransferase
LPPVLIEARIGCRMNITFRPASSHDFESLLALRIAAMRESLERIGRFDPERARERFLSGFSPTDTQHIEVNQRRVGFVVTKRKDDHLLLDHLYVDPSQQNQGIGAAVLAHVLTQAQALNLPIRLGALRDSDSNRFYLRHGFRLVEQTEFDNCYVHSIKA